MGIGDVYSVETGDCPDYYYLDTGMYATEKYGSVYIIDADRPAIVDTGIGTNYEYILDALSEIGIDRGDVAVIAPTHVHLDHAGGAGFLAEACPNADVYVHGIGAPHLVDPERLVEGTKRAVGNQWEFYTEPKPVPEDRIVELEDGDTIDLGDRTLETYHAPGHAPHQMVFYDPDTEALAAADAAGIWVPEPGFVRETSPPPNFDLEGCLDDIETIRSLSPEVLLFGHFGPAPASDGLLNEYESVLREWVAAVEEQRADLEDDGAVIDRFVSETDMDEIWGPRKAHAEVAMNTRGVCTYLDRRED